MNKVPPGYMMCLSLWQPWASFMAMGLKTFETRHWETKYRGPLAIHAAARKPNRYDIAMYYNVKYPIKDETQFPLGKVLCIVDLLKIHSTNDEETTVRCFNELEFGNYDHDRFAWETKMIQVFDQPIPAKGHQGLWHWKLPEGFGVA